jgi:hypothetical protein
MAQGSDRGPPVDAPANELSERAVERVPLHAMHMGSRILVGVTTLGTIISAVVLGVMLAAPFVPRASSAVEQTPSLTPEPTPAEELPPLGLFLMRDPWFAIDGCLALELRPESYPLDPDAAGAATVRYWQRGIVDPGHPNACSTRIAEIQEIDAEVFAIRGEGSRSAAVVGYAVHFRISAFGQSLDPGLTILARQSTQDLLQVTNELDPGSGLIFDRVEEVDPELVEPEPTPEPAAFQPYGLFLLAGPLAPDGPCLVVELGEASYPAEFGATGTARIRWWERVGAQPGHPEDCLGRTGEVTEAETSVNARGPEGAPDAYFIGLPPEVVGAVGQDPSLRIQVAESTPERLIAFASTADGETRFILDRVDSIDPPLLPPVSSP